MSDVVIRVENLSKKYVIGRSSGKPSGDGLRHVLQDLASAPFRKLRSALAKKSPALSARLVHPVSSEDFYALSDISFEVKRGEVLGIIGRNGAGKSTLLKILSRITEPTTGRIGLKGRVASLLEVGTGFHPELTGRENIYLNGAILGMSRAEVKRKFDEIVAFSGVETFLDTPVKRYSSGMYVRLAFAVAAHLEPEILIIDEVLAVGDTEFQRKCLGKMKDVAGQGRTVIFVSHQMTVIESICRQAILLNAGRVEAAGPVTSIVRQYLSQGAATEGPDLLAIGTRAGEGNLRFSRMEILGDYEQPLQSARCGAPLRLRLHWQCIPERPLKRGRISVAIGPRGTYLLLLDTSLSCHEELSLAQTDSIDCCISRFPLPPGTYYITLFCEADGQVQDSLSEVTVLTVESGTFFEGGRNRPPHYTGDFVLIEHHWQASPSAAAPCSRPAMLIA